MIKFVLPVFLLTLLTGCSAQHNPETSTSLQGFDSQSFFSLLVDSHLEGTKSKSSNFSPEDYNKSLRVVSSILLGRNPTPQELLAANEGLSEYTHRIETIVNSDEATESLRQYFHILFNMKGQMNGINYEEPTNLALYLITQDKDFRQILKADHCVDDDLKEIPCSAFTNADQSKELSAGVLTTRAFLVKWTSAFNFVRTAKAFKVFACSEYPDSTDVGLPKDKISTKVKTFDCEDCQTSCYSCHKSMNSRAYLFYDFTVDGRFNLNPPNNMKTKTDTGAVSERDDLLTKGTVPEYHGRKMEKLKDYAHLLADSRKFRDCFATRMVNFMTGVNPNEPINPEFENIRNSFSWNGYKIRQTLIDIATHPSFIRKARPL